jgi:predicted MFS family arabinose efflux permease
MNRKEVATVGLGTLLSVCGSGPFYVVPGFLGDLQQSLGLSLAQLGMISGAEGLMIMLACTLVGWRFERIDWRVMLAAAIACVMGNALIAFATDFYQVLAIRALTGLLGEGPLYAMGYVVLGSARNPDRAFGIGIGAVVVSAALVFEAAGWPLLPGPAAVLVPYAGLALVLAIVAGLARPALPGAAPSDEVDTAAVRLRALTILGSIVLWSAAAAGFWAFTDTASATLHVNPESISHALSASLLIGLAGMILPILLGNRLGRAMPIGLATAGLIASCFLFLASRDWVQLAVALSIQQFSWNVAAVYQLAGVASIDAQGRYSAYGAVAQIGGMAAGPILVGPLLGFYGYNALPFAVLVIGVAALLLFLVRIRTMAREPHRSAEGVWLTADPDEQPC